MTTNWDTQCEAVSRKTNERCPHKCCCQIPSTLANHCVMGASYYSVTGRPVHLCRSHSRSFTVRQKRLLSVRLIDGGYISAFNKHGYGTIVTVHERIDFSSALKLKVPRAWGPVEWKGNIPHAVVIALGIPIAANAAEGGDDDSG